MLKTGGTLLISVPNVASYSNLLRLFRAEQPSTFPVYRPEGVNLRHNRELTARELAALFHCGGFDVVNLDTFNASPSIVLSKHVLAMGMLCKILHGPRQHRKDTLIGTAKKVGEVRDRYPVEQRLYYQWDVERLRSQSIGEEQTKD